jgi:hypothetical protein
MNSEHNKKITGREKITWREKITGRKIILAIITGAVAGVVRVLVTRALENLF